MLQKIRRAANTTPFKILLILASVSFAISISDRFTGPSQTEIATFSDVEPVTYQDFLKMRHIKIKQIQQNSDEPISEEQIASMGLNQMIIQNLLSTRLLEFLGNKYDLDFSDKNLADVIRSMPSFRDDKNAFDIDRFKEFLRSQNLTEDEYSDYIRNSISRDILTTSMVDSAYISNRRFENIINHMTQERSIAIASISLKPKLSSSNASLEELKKFYKENQDMFKTEEVRDICYAKVNAASAKGQINVSDSDVKAYWDENKSEFKGKDFDKVKNEIKKRLTKENFDSWLMNISKSLVDEVAGGATLQEIADKYNLKRICEKNISSNNIESRADGLFVNFSSQIAEMNDKTVSYPLNLPKEDGQILFEITNIKPEGVQEFEKAKESVAIAYESFMYKQSVIKKLQDFIDTGQSASFDKDAIKFGMSISSPKTYTRMKLAENVDFPSEMFVAMFASPKNKIIGPFISDNAAYVFVVRSIGYDKKLAENIAKKAGGDIVNRFRESIFEEMLIYSQRASNMKINDKALGILGQ